MAKDAINVKSNGLRNELKEIRKSIDKLTNAITMAQTHKHDEENRNYYRWGNHPDFMQWYQSTSTGTKNNSLPSDD